MQLRQIVMVGLLVVLPCLAAGDAPSKSSSKRHGGTGLAEQRMRLDSQLGDLRAELQGLLQYASNDTNCTTMETSLLKSQAFWAKVAPPNTPCVFGLDDGDEGNHCVAQHEFGSWGWCWTKKDKSEWGSCGGTCPLIGKPNILGKHIDKAEVMLKNLTMAINTVIQKLPAGRCSTVGTVGKGAGNACIFPFTYNSVTYNGCTTTDSVKFGSVNWCYVAVDDQGVGKLGSWGECEESCPMA